MKQLPKFPNRYWLKFSEEPLQILPFDPQSKIVAEQYTKNLIKILDEYPVDIYHRGSTALEISGKGDIEIGIIPPDDYWFEAVVYLSQQYGGLGNLDDEYARLNDAVDGFDIEIILMRGYTAQLDKKLHEFLAADNILLQEYEKIKLEFCYSQREYNRQKDKFFRRVIGMIP